MDARITRPSHWHSFPLRHHHNKNKRSVSFCLIKRAKMGSKVRLTAAATATALAQSAIRQRRHPLLGHAISLNNERNVTMTR